MNTQDPRLTTINLPSGGTRFSRLTLPGQDPVGTRDGAPIALAVLDPASLDDLNAAGAVGLPVPIRPSRTGHPATGEACLTVVILAPGATPEDVRSTAQTVAQRPRPAPLRRHP